MMLHRRTIRRSLEAWCIEALTPRGQSPARHHRLLIRELEAVATGATPRLMIFMPPGTAKSTYASDLFPAWFLAQRAGLNIIAASNTADLAGSFSRRVRGRVREHGATLGYGLAREAEELWDTTTGGQYRAAGVGGTITGLRADLIVVDDPVRSREDADSETRRNRTWEWFQDDASTRLKPGGGIVVVQTRWHQDDLSGRLLERQPGTWRVLSLPAIAEDPDDPLGRAPGEALWGDDDYGYAAMLAEVKRTAEARTWAALYQQRPAPAEGTLFKREWIRRGKVPRTLRCYGASDYALTADGGDFTVHGVGGLDVDGHLWLPALWRGQATSDVTVDAFCGLVRQWKPLRWADEAGQIRAAIGPFLNARMRATASHVAIETFPTSGRGDKAVRAASIIGRMATDGLWVPDDAPWAEELIAELLAFPAGKHDDQVDMLGLLGQLLDRMVPAAAPKGPATRSRDGYRVVEDEGGESWRTV